MKKRIVLLIPCYNEEITIKKVIQKAKKIFILEIIIQQIKLLILHKKN